MTSFLRTAFLVSVLLCGWSAAQTVVKTDTLAGTPLSITLDKNVSDLLSKVEDKCATKPGSGNSSNYTDEERTTTPRVTTPTRELSQAEICRRNPRIMGFKIQVAVVKSNEEAREIGMNFRRRFPNMKVELDASLRPNYKVLAGSYLTRQSISADLSAVRGAFPSAVAVQYRVFCAEAK